MRSTACCTHDALVAAGRDGNGMEVPDKSARLKFKHLAIKVCICAFIIYSGRTAGNDGPTHPVTVAILAQGTSWADAVTQAFLAALRAGPPNVSISFSLSLSPFLFVSVRASRRGLTAIQAAMQVEACGGRFRMRSSQHQHRGRNI